MKLMVLGHARHGKDTVCEILSRDYGLKWTSSSFFVAEKVVRPALEAKGLFYSSVETMYADRHNHRAAWFNAIAAYNAPDPSRLGRALFESGCDIYCGMRNHVEFLALRAAGVIDFTIWVDASRRCPPEPESSCTVTPDMADYVLDNNGPREALDFEVYRAMCAAAARVPHVEDHA
jgi:hypothetical protein